MITLIVIILALVAVGVFFMAARSRSKQTGIKPVDMKAFRTIMDRDDEFFLRAKLPRSRFSKLKRQRISVILRYVSRVASNASVVMRLSQPACLSSDPMVAETASQVMDLATQIRMQCLVVYAKLSLEFVIPSLQLTPALLVPRYQALRENVKRLGTLQTRDAAPVAVAI